MVIQHMPVIRPTTKGQLHWWKDSHVIKSGPHKGDRRSDMYVMEAITQSKHVAFGPSNPMAYRIAFYINRTSNEVRMGYTQLGRYSSGKKKVRLIWNFTSKKRANDAYSMIRKSVTSATTFNALMNNIAALRKDARTYNRRMRG